nr:restriction endonuclease subunit S [Pseudomonas chengduensis]
MSMFANAQLPDGWKLTPIRTAFKTTEKPRGLSPANYESVPFIPMDAVPIAGWDVYPPEVRPGSEISSGTYCEDGDLLLAKITPSFENGKQAFAALDGAKFAYGTTEVIPLQAIPDQGVIEYLYSVLLHPGLRASLAGKMEGSTGRQRLGKEVLLSTPIPMPTPDEQRQIARVLATVQRAIEQQQAIIATTRELKRSLMHKLFTEGLRGEAQKPSEIGLVPESWDVKPLAQIGDVIYGIQAAVANKFAEDETPIFTNKNIDLEGRLDLTEVNSFKLETSRHFATKLQYGDVLFCWRSGSKEHVGKTAYFDLDGEFTHSSFLLRIRPPSHGVGRYLFLLLNHLRSDGYFVRMQNYAVNAKFNKSAIELLPVPLPKDEDEMREIVAALDCIMDRLELAQRKLDGMQDVFKTLLHQLMTAQLRVNDLDLDTLGVPVLD